MRVQLLTKLDFTVAILGAGVCVGVKPENASMKNLVSAVTQGHTSVLEHIPISFYIKDISRACSHQLVRHRHMSFLQQSQRYTKADDAVFIPDNLTMSQEEAYMHALTTSMETYERLLNCGIKPEIARMVLTNAQFTGMVVSMNLRTFCEACQKRFCHTAQDEIRTLFKSMRRLVLGAVADMATTKEEHPLYVPLKKLTMPKCSTCTDKRPCSWRTKG